ncbi:uncharacterized protein ACA1_073580 [Acanthamoeba castellanii str. Neff]|uniref:Uncharacterized protein n=1 Tax=Acanthamoeba castellanii (strain ATCC 30010 / Neff) TaxID=1257118 RepID=L8HDW3_ACACF|nr:uncharacterized protein ACA1_073580 [Acanthamoeba castellanii str. Neff]ELR23714.1 hypothetical protein ACA1_073580 [Acanthamoeba castellanii str. Neff]
MVQQCGGAVERRCDGQELGDSWTAVLLKLSEGSKKTVVDVVAVLGKKLLPYPCQPSVNLLVFGTSVTMKLLLQVTDQLCL